MCVCGGLCLLGSVSVEGVWLARVICGGDSSVSAQVTSGSDNIESFQVSRG